MQIVNVRCLLVMAALVTGLGCFGCAERENQVIIDTTKTPEEVQAEYDEYDSQQSNEDYQ